jgi:NAD-dependent dihydropyrimidine dehydrogenase PreA subunit
MIIDLEKCIGCGTCAKDCPVSAIEIIEKKAHITDNCVECRTCFKVCPKDAVIDEVKEVPGAVFCKVCPVSCQVPPGLTGACGRFINVQGKLMRNRDLLTYEEAQKELPSPMDPAIKEPLITAVGAGGTYPDYVPAPYLVNHKREGVDVVTALTEAPLSYSGVKLKIDTDFDIGSEGSIVRFEGRPVGMVETEEYGSKILAVGGVNRLTGKTGFAAARAVAAIANREALKLSIKGGAKLQIKVGEPPVINGEKVEKMRVGCGSATVGLFAPLFQKAADEVVVLDHHITSLFSHHAAGRFLGLTPLGIALKYRLSTPGRYFGNHGSGWGGTDIEHPLDIVAGVDVEKTPTGTRLLITETTGQNAALFELDKNGAFRAIDLTPEAKQAAQSVAQTCEPSRVSAVYSAGVGGSARRGVTSHPLKLTQAVHQGKANLTCGGAPVFLWPGGGITFYVDVEKVQAGSFVWVPTPATVAPIEYTMKLDDYEAMGGHIEALKPFDTVEPKAWSLSKS